MKLEDMIHAASEHLQTDFELTHKTIQHRGTKGSVREETLREFLRDHLPPFLGIGTGEIICSSADLPQEQQVSKQMDVVVYDAWNCPTLHHKPGAQIFPNEAVYGVIEVKSKLDSQELKNSIHNIASAKQLPKQAYYEEALKRTVGPVYGDYWDYFPTLGAIFAFSSTDAFELAKQMISLQNENELPLHQQVDLICVLDKEVVFKYVSDGGKCLCRPEPESHRAVTQTNCSLLLFYILLMQQLPQASMKPLRIAEYVPLKNFEIWQVTED